MTYKYDITAADVALAQSLAVKTCRNEIQKAASLRILRTALILAGALLFSEIVALFRKYGDTDLASDLGWALWPAIASAGIFFAYTREYQKLFAAWRDAELAPFPIWQTLLVTPEGLMIESRFGQVQYPWRAIRTLEILAEHFAFTTAATSVVIIPFRAFPTLEDRNNFEEELRSHIAAVN
jgi:hypothetical protein